MTVKVLTPIEKRAHAANQVIAAIAATGRRFFYSQAHDRTSRFDLDDVEQIWYVDHHTGMKLAPLADRWTGFTNGDNAKQLILALASYIDTGELVPFEHFQKPWGYGSAMPALITAVLKTKAIEKEKP